MVLLGVFYLVIAIKGDTLIFFRALSPKAFANSITVTRSFFALANGVYLIVIIKKFQLRTSLPKWEQHMPLSFIWVHFHHSLPAFSLWYGGQTANNFCRRSQRCARVSSLSESTKECTSIPMWERPCSLQWMSPKARHLSCVSITLGKY